MSEWNTETAEWYADRYGEYATNRLAVADIDLTPDAVVVDVGCGTGAALRHLTGRITSGTLIGIDPVPRMIEIARERAASHPDGARIEFREGFAEDLPVDDDIADVVLAFDSFDHWQDPARGLAEIRRILRSYGRFVVVKDGGVPGGDEARRTFVTTLIGAGFAVLGERRIDEGGVSFMMWVCSVAG